MGRNNRRLVQESLGDPWRVLVACILLNRTGGERVRAVLPELFAMYPDAQSMALAEPADVAGVIRRLGFADMRSRRLVRFSAEYAAGDWSEPSELHGVGQYGQDAWDILVRGRLGVEPSDHALADYVARHRGRPRRGRMTNTMEVSDEKEKCQVRI